MPNDGRFKRRVSVPWLSSKAAGKVPCPGPAATSFLNDLTPALRPRARGQENLNDLKVLLEGSAGLHGLPCEKVKEAKLSFPWEWWQLWPCPHVPSNYRKQFSSQGRPQKTSEHRPRNWDTALQLLSDKWESPGNAAEHPQGPRPRSGWSSRNSGTRFHYAAPHRNAFTQVWFNTRPLALLGIDFRTIAQKRSPWVPRN